jgi:hypothetical protein
MASFIPGNCAPSEGTEGGVDGGIFQGDPFTRKIKELDI